MCPVVDQAIFNGSPSMLADDPSVLEPLSVFDSPDTEQAFIRVDDHVADACGVKRR
jgi:hypothetical protein